MEGEIEVSLGVEYIKRTQIDEPVNLVFMFAGECNIESKIVNELITENIKIGYILLIDKIYQPSRSDRDENDKVKEEYYNRLDKIKEKFHVDKGKIILKTFDMLSPFISMESIKWVAFAINPQSVNVYSSIFLKQIADVERDRNILIIKNSLTSDLTEIDKLLYATKFVDSIKYKTMIDFYKYLDTFAIIRSANGELNSKPYISIIKGIRKLSEDLNLEIDVYNKINDLEKDNIINQTGSGSKNKFTYNGKKYTIRIGIRGGRFILVNKEKKYLK